MFSILFLLLRNKRDHRQVAISEKIPGYKHQSPY